MNKEISLNEQQVDFLKEMMDGIVREDTFYSKTTKKVAEQILEELTEG